MAYSHKLAGLKRVDFDKKTEKEKAKYIKNKYKQLGYVIPQHLQKGKITDRQLEKAINKISGNYNRGIQKEKVEKIRNKEKEKKQQNINNKSFDDLQNIFKDMTTNYNKKLEKIENQLQKKFNLSNEEMDYLKGNDVMLSVRNKSFLHDNPPLEEINNRYVHFNDKNSLKNEINYLKKKTDNLTLNKLEKQIFNSEKQNEWFDEYLESNAFNEANEMEKEMLKRQFNKMNAIQKDMAIKSVLNEVKAKYDKAEKDDITRVNSINAWNRTNTVILNILKEI